MGGLDSFDISVLCATRKVDRMSKSEGLRFTIRIGVVKSSLSTAVHHHSNDQKWAWVQFDKNLQRASEAAMHYLVSAVSPDDH